LANRAQKNQRPGVVAHYKKEDLIGKQVIAVVNFTPEQIPNFFSECLVPDVYTGEKQVLLLQPQQAVTNGMKIS